MARVFIAGVEVGNWDYNSQFQFTLTLGQIGTATLPFQVKAGQVFAPQCGDVVYIYEDYAKLHDDVCVFVGTVSAIEIIPMDNLGQRRMILTAQSIEQAFDAIMTPQIEEMNTFAGNVFSDLFDVAQSQLPVLITLGEVTAGAAINDLKMDGKSSFKSVFDQLAQDSAYIWEVDPATLKANFHAHYSRPAPWTLVDGMILNPGGQSSIDWKQDRANFRDVQVIQMVPNVVPPDYEMITGDGGTDYDLQYPINQIIGSHATTSTQANGVGTFIGQPAVGDTVMVGDQEYTFTNAISNAVAGLVKIGATDVDTCQNLADAINRNPATNGTAYSSPTWLNWQAYADPPLGGPTVTVMAKTVGQAGNAVLLASTSSLSPAAFSWGSDTLTGGTDGLFQALTSGIPGFGASDVSYLPGSRRVTFANPVPRGLAVGMSYVRSGGDVLTVMNGMGAALGLGTNYQIMQANGAVTLSQAVKQAAAALARYSTLPATLQFMCDWPGWSVGHFATIAITRPLEMPALLNGSWIVQEVQGTLVPGMERQVDNFDPSLVGIAPLPDPGGHFRYTYYLINTLGIQTWQDVINQLANTGPVNNQSPTNPGPSAPQYDKPVTRPLQINDTTVGDDVAGRAIVTTPLSLLTSPVSHQVGQGTRIIGVLRLAISADLTVRFNKLTLVTSPMSTTSWTVTIPSATPINEQIVFPISGSFFDQDLLTVDITASDGSKDDDAIAIFYVEYAFQS